MFRTGTTPKTQRRLLIPKSQRKVEKGNSSGYGVPFRDDDNVLKLVIIIVAQL